ncbi:MAG: RIP metalloprotease RseP [Pseudomonadota bacterium]
MSLLSTIAAFLLALGVLIVFHELGHYWVARLCGVRVLRFSVGFGKPLLVKRYGPDRTEWVISAFPLGGYVKMLDEREAPVDAAERHRAFNRQSVYRRFAIVSAGPIANFLLAVVLYWGLFLNGVPGIKPLLGPVVPDSPAAVAGLAEGDLVRKVDGDTVETWQDLRWALLDHAVSRGRVALELDRAGAPGKVVSLDLSGVQGDDFGPEFLDRLGLVSFRPALKPVVGQVVAGGAGERAGLRKGDRITAIDGRPLERWDALVQIVRGSPERALQFEIERGEARVRLTVVPDAVQDGDIRIGRIGVGPEADPAAWEGLTVVKRLGVLGSLGAALQRTWETTVLSLKMLYRMVLGDVSWRNVSGPITIADYAGQTAQIGAAAYLGFIALVSISLGILNLLPIPMLDGGHLMYYVVEIFKGRPVSEKAMEVGQQVGMVLLFALMAFALFNDINRLLTG